MNSLIKSLLGRIVYGTGANERLWRNRAVITAFHTIREEPQTPISCSRAEFATYCDFFGRHFHVVSLSELLGRLALGRDISRHLVITFDDGYKDNYEVAMAELEQRGLPACFFVTTEFLGSDHQTWWDKAAGVTSRWMSWDEVRDLHARGFEIGAHTATHVDMGKVDPDVAVQEMSTSLDRLERELGTRPTLFAYPYGRPDNMTEANRAAVRGLGLECCLSCFGGTVGPGADPFRLERAPISPWFRSVYQFGFETASLGWLREREAAGVDANHVGRARRRQQELIQPERLLDW
jgi:peptidoglycan/xylan/chitin deacetylase (PgdA/CDA1 family)